MDIKKYFFVVIAVSFLTAFYLSCSTESVGVQSQTEQSPTEQSQPDPEGHCVMTVFIHGTQTFRYVYRTFLETMQKGWAKHAINFFCLCKNNKRRDELYKAKVASVSATLQKYDKYACQPIGPQGLCTIDLNEEPASDAQEYIAHQVARLYNRVYYVVHEGHRFSRRKFGDRVTNKIELPDYLYQIDVKFGKYKPTHDDFWHWRHKYLWGFGQSKKLPLTPLPISVFTLLLTAMADEIVSQQAQDRRGLCKLDFDKQSNRFCLEGGYQCVSQVIDVEALRDIVHESLRFA